MELLERPVTIQDLQAIRNHQQRNKIRLYFPAEGAFRRELYPKHLEFFAAGARYKERLFMAANRVGKSEAGAFETACHLTGNYPDWWVGHRFTQPIEVWACGTTSETTRDIVQAKLLGMVGHEGTGMIPGNLIVHTTPRRAGLSGSVESAWVRHVSGKNSLLGLKTYEQGRKSFEGTSKHLIWLDEEPPEDIYTECLTRTLTTRGSTLITFTPLQGISAVVKGFLEPEKEESKLYKWFVQAGWDHAPHIPEEEKKRLLATYPPHQILARTTGEPSLGAGAIYPIAESEITVPATTIIPASWPRVYGMDVGWNRTAVIWGARDISTGRIILYAEHYQSEGQPASHAFAIKERGDWIPGVIDPASEGRNQVDGRSLMDMYRKLGLKLEPADNSVESGLQQTWQLLVSGQLKVMESCFNWLSEFRKYHRSEKADDTGKHKIVKRWDHLMDATRYLIMSGRERMKPPPQTSKPQSPESMGGNLSWMT